MGSCASGMLLLRAYTLFGFVMLMDLGIPVQFTTVSLVRPLAVGECDRDLFRGLFYGPDVSDSGTSFGQVCSSQVTLLVYFISEHRAID